MRTAATSFRSFHFPRPLLLLAFLVIAKLGFFSTATFVFGQAKPAAKPAATSARQQTEAASAWRLRNYQGRGYVTLTDIAKFYGFAAPSVKGKGITMVARTASGPIYFEGTIGLKRIRLANIAFHLSYPLVTGSDGAILISTFDVSNVLDAILRGQVRREPSTLRVIVLDPACGGAEPGITTPYGVEKNISLAVALKMKPMLEQEGFTVVMTRDDDSAVFPLERVRLANLLRSESIYISLSVGESADAKTHGLITATLPPANTPATSEPDDTPLDRRFYPGNINDRESMALATKLHASILKSAAPLDLGIKRVRHEELRGIRMPAIVCQLGFLTNKTEAEKLATDAYQQKLAASIVGGVESYAKDFLSVGLAEWRALEAKAPLRLGSIQTTRLDAAAGIAGERVSVKVPIIALPATPIDRSKMEIQLFVFEQVNGIELDLTIASPPKIEWLTVLPDWKALDTEVFQATYDRAPMNREEMSAYGRRRYYGYVARLIYNGLVMDEVSEPKNLNRALFYFTPVFPRR